jgi:hypothetical protein
VTPPAWILDALAGVMLAVAGVSAVRLAGARPWRRGTAVTDTDVGHLLMAIAMAGTLAAGLRTLPGAAWVAIFAVLTSWFGYRVAREARAGGVRALAGRHCTPHLVHSGAMIYMFLALPRLAAAGAGIARAQVPLPRVRLRADPGRVLRLGPRPAVRQALPAGVRGGHGRLPDCDERHDGLHAAHHDLTESGGSLCDA